MSALRPPTPGLGSSGGGDGAGQLGVVGEDSANVIDTRRDTATLLGHHHGQAAATLPLHPQRAFRDEALAITFLAAPLFIGQVAWVMMKVTDSALLGHTPDGTLALNAASLSDLWTASSAVVLIVRVLSVFTSQAWGAGNKNLVGIWLQVAIACAGVMTLAVAALWLSTGPVLRLFGTDEALVAPASLYAAVLSVSLPALALNMLANQFFQAQHIVMPNVVASIAGMLFNLLVGLVLVLGIPFGPAWGFVACPGVTAASEYVQLAAQVCIVSCTARYATVGLQCWPGWSKRHFTRERIMSYMRMFGPAALGLGVDYWRWAIVGFLAAELGANDAGAFVTVYKVLRIALAAVGAVGSAMSIRIGNALGAGDMKRAKWTVRVGMAIAAGIIGCSTLVVVVVPRQLGQIFSDDEAWLDLFEDMRWSFGATMLFQNLAYLLNLLLLAMGRSRATLWGVAPSLLQIPFAFIMSRGEGGNVSDVLMGVAAGYVLHFAMFQWLVMRTDWKDMVHQARTRSEANADRVDHDGNREGIALVPQHDRVDDDVAL